METWQDRCRARGGQPLSYNGAPSCRIPNGKDASGKPLFRYLPADLSFFEYAKEAISRIGDSTVRAVNTASEGIGADKGVAGVLGTILSGDKESGLAGGIGKVLGVPRILVWAGVAGVLVLGLSILSKRGES